MRYEEVVAAVGKLVDDASVDVRRWFAAGSMVTLLDFPDRDAVLRRELTPEARARFLDMAGRALTATAQELHEALAATELGLVLVNAPDPDLARAIGAIGAYAVVLDGDSADGAGRMAWLRLQGVEERNEADPDDYLAGAELAAEFAAIRAGLAPWDPPDASGP